MWGVPLAAQRGKEEASTEEDISDLGRARGNWALVHRNAPGFLSPNGDTTCESWMVCKLTLTCTGRDDPDTGWVKELLRNLI